METFETITCVVDGPVAHVTLNRPESRNAMSNAMVAELLRCFTAFRDDPEHATVRVVVLGAEGTVFCSGGDVRDMSAASSLAESDAAVRQLDHLLHMVNQAPQVVVARVQGAAMGGGLGLLCVTDYAVAGENASFAFPEVRLGLVPSIISPYVVQRIGLTHARQLMLTGRRFGAEVAQTCGLVQEVCVGSELDARVDAVVADVLRCAPGALRACKELLFTVLTQEDTAAYRVSLLNRLRASEEAQQGMMAFLTKQPAPWVPKV